MTDTGEPVWLAGFFTGRRHAVVDVANGWTFHGVRLVWSVCGRPAVLDSDDDDQGLCDRCVFLAGPASVLSGQ